MVLTFKRGVISNIDAGEAGAGGKKSFNIDFIPAQSKGGSLDGTSNGDRITAVGQVKSNKFMVYAIRNETTGIQNEAQTTMQMVLGIILTIAGVLLTIFVVGIPMIFFGIRLLYFTFIRHRANTMLQENY